MKYQFNKKPLWQRVLGKLGFKKYKYTHYYGWDLGINNSVHVDVTCFYDDNGVLNIVDFKIKEEINNE